MATKQKNAKSEIELSIVMPCLNEEKTVGNCVAQAKSFLKTSKVKGEVIVADNGSTDNSVRIAEETGARVIFIANKGYGSALMGGFEAASGKYIIMTDADESYELVNLMPFVEKLREGYDLVMGNNFGLLPNKPKYFSLFKCFTLEFGLGVGTIAVLFGIVLIIRATTVSYTLGFETIGFGNSVRLVFGGALSIIIGGQVILTSFVLSMLGIVVEQRK